MILYIFFIVTVLAITDIGAYIFGRMIGGKKIWPKISPNKTYIDKGKINQIDRTVKISSLDNKEESIYTAETLNEFLKKAHTVLANHWINKKRTARGLLPANYILIDAPSNSSDKLNSQKKWMCITNDVEGAGFSLMSGMKTYFCEYPKQKTIDAYLNMHHATKKLSKVVEKSIKKNYENYEYVYIHIKEASYSGYDNKPLARKLLLEEIDKSIFKFLKKFCPEKQIKVCVTSSSSIPCKLKTASGLAVPILLYDNQIPRENKFTEFNCRSGTFGKIESKKFLEKIGFI